MSNLIFLISTVLYFIFAVATLIVYLIHKSKTKTFRYYKLMYYLCGLACTSALIADLLILSFSFMHILAIAILFFETINNYKCMLNAK